MSDEPDYRFEVAFSFAGDNKRDKVRAVAEFLRDELGEGRVFFDEWFEAELAGPDANVVLQSFYRRMTRVVVTCVCNHYNEKPWTQEEWRAIQALERELRDANDGNVRRMRFLPLRFGDGEVDGLFETAIVPDVRTREPRAIANLILERLRLARGEPQGLPGSAEASTFARADALAEAKVEAETLATEAARVEALERERAEAAEVARADATAKKRAEARSQAKLIALAILLGTGAFIVRGLGARPADPTDSRAKRDECSVLVAKRAWQLLAKCATELDKLGDKPRAAELRTQAAVESLNYGYSIRVEEDLSEGKLRDAQGFLKHFVSTNSVYYKDLKDRFEARDVADAAKLRTEAHMYANRSDCATLNKFAAQVRETGTDRAIREVSAVKCPDKIVADPGQPPSGKNPLTASAPN